MKVMNKIVVCPKPFDGKANEKYIELLKNVLSRKKVWERNEILTAFKKELKVKN